MNGDGHPPRDVALVATHARAVRCRCVRAALARAAGGARMAHRRCRLAQCAARDRRGRCHGGRVASRCAARHALAGARLDARDPTWRTAPTCCSPRRRDDAAGAAAAGTPAAAHRTAPTAGPAPRWSGRKLLATVPVSRSLAIAVILLWPTRTCTRAAVQIRRRRARPNRADADALWPAALRIAPPALHAPADRREDGFDAKAPQGTRLHWTLRFAAAARAAALVFHDGRSRRADPRRR